MQQDFLHQRMPDHALSCILHRLDLRSFAACLPELALSNRRQPRSGSGPDLLAPVRDVNRRSGLEGGHPERLGVLGAGGEGRDLRGRAGAHSRGPGAAGMHDQTGNGGLQMYTRMLDCRMLHRTFRVPQVFADVSYMTRYCSTSWADIRVMITTSMAFDVVMATHKCPTCGDTQLLLLNSFLVDQLKLNMSPVLTQPHSVLHDVTNDAGNEEGLRMLQVASPVESEFAVMNSNECDTRTTVSFVRAFCRQLSLIRSRISLGGD
uniref:F-box domain-containing protein n=1 Tax=Macrostomum lignano TaxID=282301 RepID=A0A1I8GA58_9PLAT